MTTLRPFGIVNSAPAPQDVFVLDGYITLANSAAAAVYQVYNQNPELLSQTYNQSGSSVSVSPQPLSIDSRVAVLNVALENASNTGLTSGTVQRTNTTQASISTTIITIDAGASAVDNFYNGMYITISGQTRLITAYDGTLKEVTVSPGFPSTPGFGTSYTITNNVATLQLAVSSADGTPLALDQTLGSANSTFSVNEASFVQAPNVITTTGGLVVLAVGSNPLVLGATLSVRLVCVNA
jgi:hypothetical protein